MKVPVVSTSHLLDEPAAIKIRLLSPKGDSVAGEIPTHWYRKKSKADGCDPSLIEAVEEAVEASQAMPISNQD